MSRLSASLALLLALGLIASSPAQEPSPRSRESFNAGWRFARFGPMPDGSNRPEPGAPRSSIRLSASSEETGKGNSADLAYDGDDSTRWCASGGGLAQWLALDLGRDLP